MPEDFEVCRVSAASRVAAARTLVELNLKGRVGMLQDGSGMVYATCAADVPVIRQALAARGLCAPEEAGFSPASGTRRVRLPGAGAGLPWELLLRFNLTSWVTWVEIGCVLVYIAQFFAPRAVLYTLALNPRMPLDDPASWYRLLSPCLVHFSLLHIAFNLVMWEALARPLERRLGRLNLVGLTLVVGVLSNALQYFLMSDLGTFGGLSGVVYGVIGCEAALVKLRPGMSDLVPPGLFTVSLIFIGLGFFLSGIANFCHLGGLAAGMLWGALISFKSGARRS